MTIFLKIRPFSLNESVLRKFVKISSSTRRGEWNIKLRNLLKILYLLISWGAYIRKMAQLVLFATLLMEQCVGRHSKKWRNYLSIWLTHRLDKLILQYQPINNWDEILFFRMIQIIVPNVTAIVRMLKEPKHSQERCTRTDPHRHTDTHTYNMKCLKLSVLCARRQCKRAKTEIKRIAKMKQNYVHRWLLSFVMSRSRRNDRCCCFNILFLCISKKMHSSLQQIFLLILLDFSKIRDAHLARLIFIILSHN